jgi:hypothetical protein
VKTQCVCGKAYHPKQAWIHAGCVVNTASNAVVNAAESVVNNDQRGTPLDQPFVGVDAQTTSVRRDMPERRQTKWQQENRERYNKRLREYMRLKRAGFIGIAYG